MNVTQDVTQLQLRVPIVISCLMYAITTFLRLRFNCVRFIDEFHKGIGMVRDYMLLFDVAL